MQLVSSHSRAPAGPITFSHKARGRNESLAAVRRHIAASKSCFVAKLGFQKIQTRIGVEVLALRAVGVTRTSCPRAGGPEEWGGGARAGHPTPRSGYMYEIMDLYRVKTFKTIFGCLYT